MSIKAPNEGVYFNFLNSLRSVKDGLRHPIIMGVLNLTPDSFSDGGQFSSVDQAIARAQLLIQEGADIIDIGAESTRPGSSPVSLSEENARLMPVLERLQFMNIPFSVDTSKPEVMQAAVSSGAVMLNDINGFQAPGALELCAQLQTKTPFLMCIMHMQNQPINMQEQPAYVDCETEINLFFEQQIQRCSSLGISINQICLDPGFGFGKSDTNNWQLLQNLRSFHRPQTSLLVGLSRKSMLGRLLDRPVDQRLAASIGAALASAANGAHIIRVHDVQATSDALKVFYRSTP